MKILTSNKKYYLTESDILFVPVPVDDTDILNEIDNLLGGELRDELVSSGFNSEFGERLWLSGSHKIKAKKVVLLGLGDRKDINLETIRRWGGEVITLSKKSAAKNITIHCNFNKTNTVKALSEGLWLADYKFLKYKKEELQKEKNKAIEKVEICSSKNIANSENEVRKAALGVLGTTYARDLVNEPANNMRPKDLVNAALEIADKSPSIELGVLGKRELEENGFGGLLSIAKGSEEEPYLIHLFYSGSKKPKKRIALVGKGITFDSGGISLKPSDNMMDMKIDMAGAATVLGVFKSLSLMDIPIEVHGIIPTCENMPSGGAIRPGDIIKSHSGKTIEILNTDAEGRVILADALSYVSKEFMPNTIVELSTLTGACMVALGENIAGIMTNFDELSDSLMQASDISGEKLWRLPLHEDYKEKMKSDIADIKNVTSKKYGGATMGGMFLQEFVPEEIEFAHIDIAGPASETEGKIKYLPKGATGFCVRTIVNWLELNK